MASSSGSGPVPVSTRPPRTPGHEAHTNTNNCSRHIHRHDTVRDDRITVRACMYACACVHFPDLQHAQQHRMFIVQAECIHSVFVQCWLINVFAQHWKLIRARAGRGTLPELWPLQGLSSSLSRPLCLMLYCDRQRKMGEHPSARPLQALYKALQRTRPRHCSGHFMACFFCVLSRGRQPRGKNG